MPKEGWITLWYTNCTYPVTSTGWKRPPPGTQLNLTGLLVATVLLTLAVAILLLYIAYKRIQETYQRWLHPPPRNIDVELANCNEGVTVIEL